MRRKNKVDLEIILKTLTKLKLNDLRFPIIIERFLFRTVLFSLEKCANFEIFRYLNKKKELTISIDLVIS